MKKLGIGLLSVIIILILFVAGKMGYQIYQSKHPIDVYQHRSDIKHDKSKHYITIFYDLKCPDCKELHDDMLQSPEFNHLLKDKNTSVKYIPHPILSNNGLSNRFANMADSVNTEGGNGAYLSFIDTSYKNFNEKDPKKIVHKLDLGNDVEKAINDNYDAKDVDHYKNAQKQTSKFNITETPTVYVDDEKVNFNHVTDAVKKLKK